MPVNLLQKDAVTETYKDMQNLINQATWQFCDRYGGDFEELRAEANLTFVQTCKTHKENKGAFSTWLRWCIWKELLNHAVALYKQTHNTISDSEKIETRKSKTNQSFSPLELLDGLREDTKTVICLIWNPPKELKNVKTNGEHPCHMKVVLRNYLFDLGWTGRRIKESFEEIGRVINA